MRPNIPTRGAPNRPIDISDNFLNPAYFYSYIALIVIAALSNIFSTVIILKKPDAFHFSFLLILVQVLLSGVVKLLIRSLLAINISVNLFLLDFEIIFDFGILAFAFLMSLNRFALILFPTRPILHEKRTIQYLLSSLVWCLSLLGSVGFFVGGCERRVFVDGSFSDVCTLSSGYFVNGVPSADYMKNPDLYDAAELIRNILTRCYDVLPVLAFMIYSIIAVMIVKRKKVLSSNKTRSDFKVLAQGFAVLVVYGIASIMNIFLSQYYNSIRTIPGGAIQLFMFLYIAIDVITVTVIPLSIFLAVPALRATPKELLELWSGRTRRRVLARDAVAKWRAPPAKTVVPVNQRRSTVPLSIHQRSSEVHSR